MQEKMPPRPKARPAEKKMPPRPKARPDEMTTRSRSDSYVDSAPAPEESADRMAKRAREPRAAAIYDAVRGRAQRNRDAAEVRSAADSASSTMRRARQEEAMDDLELRGVRGYKDGGMVRNAGRAQVSGKAFRGSF